MTTPARNVVFLGTHGQYNIGDELLLETFLTRLGDQHRYVVNSYDVPFTRAQLADRFTVEVIDTARDRRRLLRELLRCDLLVFGGGSIIKELYASTGRHRYSTLLMILAIVTVTRRVARKPIAMLNIGVGPLRSTGGLRIARAVLSQVDLLTVRDARSLATCQEIDVPAVLATDAVFSADAAALLGDDGDPRAEDRAEDRAEGRAEEGERPEVGPRPVRVALNLNFDIENPAGWERFLTELARSIELLAERHLVELHALPMQTGFKDNDDASVIDAFARRLPTVPFVTHEVGSHEDAARLIARCDVVLAERLHAVVMASVLGVPTFVLAYDVKVRELAAMLQVEQWTVDINNPLDAEDVADRLGHLLDDRAAVAAHLTARSGELRAQARQSFEDARAWVAS